MASQSREFQLPGQSGVARVNRLLWRVGNATEGLALAQGPLPPYFEQTNPGRDGHV